MFYIVLYIIFYNELLLANLLQNCPENINVPTVCLAREFACPDKLTCIHHSWVCDGDNDCPDGSDEKPESVSYTHLYMNVK